jgi:Omp85 superfamily domain
MRRSKVAIPLALALILARGAAQAGGDESKDDEKERAEHNEFDLAPIVGGSSDIGVGGGAVGALTRFARQTEPDEKSQQRWEWRVEASTFATVRTSPHVGMPYQDHWLLLTLPRLDGGRLRVTTRVAFTEEMNVRYFGVGNATPAPPDSGADRFKYTRIHPTVEANARISLVSQLFATVGASLTLNWLDVPTDGKLSMDMRDGSPEVKRLLGTARTSAVALAQESLSWDSRDDEVVPRRGSFHELQVRVSPGMGSAFPYSYAEVLAIARTYIPVGSRVVVALRGLGDALLGDPPFFSLANYDDTYAIGGAQGVRGVPGQRYYGRAKLIANLEVRTDIVRFRAIAKPWAIALVPFFDAGRLWADWSPQPSLDGTGFGLKYGTGLGIRLRQGQAFVVRGDIAWSPDAQPIGGYFAAGQAF